MSLGRFEPGCPLVILRLTLLKLRLTDVVGDYALGKAELCFIVFFLLCTERDRKLLEFPRTLDDAFIVGYALIVIGLAREQHPWRRDQRKRNGYGQPPCRYAAHKSVRLGGADMKLGFSYQSVTEDKHRRQHEHYEYHRYHRADADKVTHARDRAGRHPRTDEKSRRDERRTGGDNGREREVHCVYHGFLRLKSGRALLVVVRGDNYRVVNVAAHLNGACYKVDHKQDAFPGEHRQAEVYPYAALDDEREQQRHADRAEGKHQNEHDHNDTHHADHNVILCEGLLEAVRRHSVADKVAFVGVILCDNGMEAVEQLKGLVAVVNNTESEDDAVVMLSLELVGSKAELSAERRYKLRLFLVKRDRSVVYLFV